MRRRFTRLFFLPILASFFFTHAVFALTNDDEKRGAVLNDAAIRATKAGDFDAAERDFLQALVYSEENPKVRKNLGVIYYEKAMRFEKSGDPLNAEMYLKKALETEPGNVRYKKAYGSILFLSAQKRAAEGRDAEAVQLFEKAFANDKKNITACVQAAHYAWKINQIALARSYYEQCREIDAQDKNVKILAEKLKTSPARDAKLVTNSEHFILSSEDALTAKQRSHEVLEGLEEIYNEVSYKLSFSPKDKIAVVMYPLTEFRDHWRLPARVAAVYDEKLHVPYPGPTAPFAFLKPILRHELTHAFLHSMIGHAFPQWLNEGLAQWMEGRTLSPKNRDALVIYGISKRIPDIGHLDGAFQAQRNPYNNTEMTIAYMKSFSLVEYMVERYGLADVLRLAKDPGDTDSQFRKIFHDTPQGVEAAWFQWLERKKIEGAGQYPQIN